MNDRFKFRAWDIEEQKYREVIALGQDRSFLLNIGHVRNDTQIFEQCTGLKDKNGTLIYEGDIVDFDDSETYATIEWGEEDGCWQIITCCEKSFYTFDNLYGHELTVIGNIHENEDLIKVGGK